MKPTHRRVHLLAWPIVIAIVLAIIIWTLVAERDVESRGPSIEVVEPGTTP